MSPQSKQGTFLKESFQIKKRVRSKKQMDDIESTYKYTMISKNHKQKSLRFQTPIA